MDKSTSIEFKQLTKTKGKYHAMQLSCKTRSGSFGSSVSVPKGIAFCFPESKREGRRKAQGRERAASEARSVDVREAMASNGQPSVKRGPWT